MTFNALVVSQDSSGQFTRAIETRSVTDLPPGDLLIRVLYSSLNYKDALSATGNKGVTRAYPHTPGIDAAGVVVESSSDAFSIGEEVIVTGFDLGMNTPGGYGQFIQIPASWAIPKPAGWSLIECMMIGTAGLTAGIGLYKMEQLGMTPSSGAIVVTGASGGVGSLATALLSRQGYHVTATTGKKEAMPYLYSLGAKVVESRSYATDHSNKPLLKSRWAGAIDTVGGNTLATLLKGCSQEGVIVSTGLVDNAELHTTVFPFILNGVSLVGVGSAETPIERKKKVWELLSGTWNIKELLPKIGKVVSLKELNEQYIPMILRGQLKGRIVVDMQD